MFSNWKHSARKCALDSLEITKTFAMFCSALIRKVFYLKRWLQVLDIFLEKGKGLVLGKLWTMQLIEIDLQLLMRIYVGERNKDKIKEDSRLSKFNCRSKFSYSIEMPSLEKRFMHNATVKNG